MNPREDLNLKKKFESEKQTRKESEMWEKFDSESLVEIEIILVIRN